MSSYSSFDISSCGTYMRHLFTNVSDSSLLVNHLTLLVPLARHSSKRDSEMLACFGLFLDSLQQIACLLVQECLVVPCEIIDEPFLIEQDDTLHAMQQFLNTTSSVDTVKAIQQRTLHIRYSHIRVSLGCHHTNNFLCLSAIGIIHIVERKGIEASHAFHKNLIEGLMSQSMKFQCCVITDASCM